MPYCQDTTCSILLNSRCVYYESSALPVTGINTNDSLQTALQKIEDAIAAGGGGGSAIWGDIIGTVTDQTDLTSYISNNYTPQSRILTINGVSQDLSGNRSWSVGMVTSLTPGTGISIGGTLTVPTITNTAPDQTVVLNNGTGISVTGTYPNFTITNTAPSLGGDMILASAQTSTGKKSFTSDGTNAGLRLLPFAGTPSLMLTGEIVFNSTQDAYVGRTTTAGNIVFLYGTLGGFITNGVPYMVGNALDGAINMSSSLIFDGAILSAPDISATRVILSTGGTDAHLNTGSIAGDATTNLANAQMWYNSSTHTFRGRVNGANVSFLTGTVAVTSGGTGVITIPALSIWVADTLDTITTVTPAAGQSIRINAGNTAWEAYTPGSGGITNGAIANELMKSDGTNAVSSGLGSTTAGDLNLGLAATAGATRLVQTVGSAGVIGLTFQTKGSSSASAITFTNNSGVFNVFIDGLAGDTRLISTVGDLIFGSNAELILGGTIISLVPDSGAGNISLGVNNGTFGGGVRVTHIANATTNPTSAPVNGIIIYGKDSTDGASNATLGLYLEQDIEAIGTFTPSNKIKIWINEVEYWIQLEAV
jgi:hypothetical protein